MLDKLEVGKTYVFKDDVDKACYLKTHIRNSDLMEKHYKGGLTLDKTSAGGVVYGCIDDDIVISPSEIKYFKLKDESKMLKQDDKIQVEMTALEVLLVKNILGATIGNVHYPLYKRLKYIEGVPQSEYFGDKDYTGDLSKGSKFYNWVHSQFKSPHQEKIEQLEKEIHEKASELAKLKMEE